MNVLSLFDGISCGRIALERAGISVDKYYASEINKYATAISNFNYPDIIRLGDVTKWQEWNLPQIDLILAGSPCQGFSVAGSGLNFNDPRSALFFTFVDILKFYKPKYFLLENVKMKKEWQNIITEYVGVDPILINSALVSAQNRNRLYWTNIPNVLQPEDKHIYLKDILLDDATEPMLSNIYGGFKERKPRTHYNKSVTIRTSAGGGHIPSVTLKNKPICIKIIPESYKPKGNYFPRERVFSVEGKARAVTTSRSQHPQYGDNDKYRKLIPIEGERLQTLADNYTLLGTFEDGSTKEISDTQRFNTIGNGWTVDVIAHIMKGINNED